MKLFKIAYLSGIFIMAITGCSKKTTSVVSSAAYTTPESIVQKTESDGSVTLRVWGKGMNKADAIEQAKKNAVYDVIFKEIRGAGGVNSHALVNEVNARERYEEYFDPFFADGGEYNKFVTEELANQASRLEAKGSSIMSYGILAKVNRPALKAQLINDGILKR